MLRRSPTSLGLHALRLAERRYKRLRVSANCVAGWTDNDPEVLDRFWKASSELSRTKQTDSMPYADDLPTFRPEELQMKSTEST